MKFGYAIAYVPDFAASRDVAPCESAARLRRRASAP